ncbi:MAG TPA: dephospho-CoA kinase [Mogibacterium sp.]|nr:dephospho-CoA kinase [Mogibacterium sp.]
MITVAITGGIGSGKSTVTEYLISLGFIVVDADAISRQMTAPAGDAIPYIREHFGSSYILEDGSMDREAMRALVYTDSKALKILEKGTTEAVIQRIDKIKSDALNSGFKVIFFDIPLLFEKNQQDNYDFVWLITADYNTRLKRVMLRDAIDKESIEKIMQVQKTDDFKKKEADIIISNDGTLDELYTSIDKILKNCSLL